jgi:hypothetical protein
MSPNYKEALRIGLIFLIALTAFSYFNRDNNRRDHSVESRMALVKALAEEGRFEIDSYHNSLFSTSDKALYDGHYYSDKAIGISLLGAIIHKAILTVGAQMGWSIPFKYFRDVITILTVSALSAWIAPLYYLFIRRISSDTNPGRAAMLALVLALGLPSFKFSTFFYGHSPAGLFLLAAFYIWFVYRQTDVITWPRVFLSGFLLGWMILTEYPTVLLAAAAGIYILYVLGIKRRLGDWRIFVQIGLGGSIPIGILLFYNFAAFGNMLSLSYTHEAAATFNIAHNTGLFGVSLPNPAAIVYMTIHHTMGIFWQSPVLLLAIPGWYMLLKSTQYRAEGWFSLLTITLYLVFMSGYYWWWGYAFTPRHLIPTMPLFALPIAFVPRKYFPYLILAGIVSVFQMLVVAAGNSDGLPELLIGAFVTGTITSPGSTVYSIYFANLQHGLFVHNLGETIFNLEGYAMFLPLAVIEGIFLMALLVSSKERVMSHPARESKTHPNAQIDRV